MKNKLKTSLLLLAAAGVAVVSYSAWAYIEGSKVSGVKYKNDDKETNSKLKNKVHWEASVEDPVTYDDTDNMNITNMGDTMQWSGNTGGGTGSSGSGSSSSSGSGSTGSSSGSGDTGSSSGSGDTGSSSSSGSGDTSSSSSSGGLLITIR